MTWTASTARCFANGNLAGARRGLPAAEARPGVAPSRLALRHLVLGALVVVAASGGLGVPAATPAGFVIRGVTTELRNGVYYAHAELDLNFSDEALEALANGVALTVQYDFQLLRERRWWWDERVVTLNADYELELHALSKQYVVRNLNLGTTQSYPSLASVRAALGDVDDFPIVDVHLLDDAADYSLRVRARLDIEALPAPLRPLAYLSSLWRLDSDWYRRPLRPGAGGR